ncbi:MAG: D-sedoheptulose 7-phosphate isomerase [Deltaproteobacteria bacterium]|nr:D-sedoheptulose 7-phosphate isomerase [Deltaproteobacteria bacterium]
MFRTLLDSHLDCLRSLSSLEQPLVEIARRLLASLSAGRKILICGNGGSAADSQHFAAELVGRFRRERRGWPAIALTTDTSILTAVANDYGYERVFARQVEALGKPGDVLVGLSTSGNSENVRLAVREARALGMESVGLLGRDGGTLKEEVTHPVVVTSPVSARVQEAHIFILHFWADFLDQELSSEVSK